MDAEKANYEVTRMARLLGVTRQGYYAWRKQRQTGPGPRAQRRTEIDQAVRNAFHASDEVYGAPRIARELAIGGVAVDRKTVAASMRRQGLEGISPAMFTPVTTIQDPAARGFADHAQRRWDQGRLDAVWTSDITYLHTGEGRLYVAAVRDGHSRRVLGWAMDERQDAGLVDRALRMAHTLRGTVPDGLVFHADRGGQYTSQTLIETCEELGVLRPRSPVHRAEAVRERRGAWGSAVDGEVRGVMGQRDGRVVLGHDEVRVVRPPLLADSGRGPPRGRPLDRDRLQPSPAALQRRLRQPGRVRESYRTRPGRD